MFQPTRKRVESSTSETTDTDDVVGADKLFREHSAYVRAFLRRLGIREASVDDAVQEVFLVVHRRGGYREGPASARTWLGAITVRVAANARRTCQRKRETVDHRALENHPTESAPDSLAEAREDLARAARVLDRMNETHRDVFLRFVIGGQSCDDIAHTLGVPTGTIYSRLHAARNTLSASVEVVAA